MPKYNTIIWDWNGTLLNDIDASLNSINPLLEERGLNIHSRESYRNVFGFPVKDYYVKSGFDFDKDDWEILAYNFIHNFKQELGKAQLFNEVPHVLKFLQEIGVEQYILSAMEHNSLTQNVTDKGIADFFNHISGIDNIYAASKEANGKKLLKEFSLDPNRSLFIGDTIHDYEVASSLGIDCALFSGGHQEISRLEATNCKYVLSDLLEVKKLV